MKHDPKRSYMNFNGGLRSMFARQLDICFYIVNKVVNKILKMTKIWVKFVPKSLQSADTGPKTQH